MDFSQILLYAGLFLGGAVAALTVIAPRTKTKVDDKVLEYALAVEKALEALGHPNPAAVTDKADEIVAKAKI